MTFKIEEINEIADILLRIKHSVHLNHDNKFDIVNKCDEVLDGIIDILGNNVNAFGKKRNG